MCAYVCKQQFVETKCYFVVFQLLSGEITGISGGHLEGEDPDQRHRARRADKISRKLFPLAFAVFNAGYWGFYAFWNFS